MRGDLNETPVFATVLGHPVFQTPLAITTTSSRPDTDSIAKTLDRACDDINASLVTIVWLALFAINQFGRSDCRYRPRHCKTHSPNA